MQRYSDLVNQLDENDLAFLLNHIASSLEHKLDSLVSIKKLQQLSETYELNDEDLNLFQDVSSHVLVESTTNRSFETGQKLLKKLKIDKKKIMIFQVVFQENANVLWNQVKGTAHATDNVIERTGARVTLPLHESHNPMVQEYTYNDKLKYSYSDDVKNPRLKLNFKFKPQTSSGLQKDDLVVELEKNVAQKLFEETERIKDHIEKLLQ